MAQFSENDINEAKRRVMEMQNKASQLFEAGKKPAPIPVENEKNENEVKAESNEKREDSLEKDDKSFLIILALILILSKEGADNTLILALLYLLL